MTLSPQTQELLDVIKTYTKEHGRPPNKSELRKLNGMSRVTAQRRVDELIKSKHAKKVKPVIIHTADYELL